jgi:hypothetical protein
MTLDELQNRDRRIAELEAIPKERRNGIEQDELGRLSIARDAHWRRLPEALAIARRKARDLETYARQWRLPLNQESNA